MACTSPLFRLPAIIPEQVPEPFRKRIRNKGVVMSREDRDYLIQVHNVPEDNIQQIPCGQCKDCRLEYSRQWAIRCMLESNYHEHNYFVTLTYDNDHLPDEVLFDQETGELFQNEKGYLHNLDDTDATKFLKRLRSEFVRKGLKAKEDDIRYFYCGEYGDKTQRPHFHFLFFGLDVPDLTISHVRNGNVFYSSPLISKIWGKGIVVLGEVCFDTCAYVSRYVMKKQKGKGKKELEERVGVVMIGDKVLSKSDLSSLDDLLKAKGKKFKSEFCRMSRRPAIAKRYFDEHKGEIYKTDELFVKTNKGLMTVKPCRYYDKLYDVENPEQLSDVKFNRKKVGKANKFSREERTSLNDVEYNRQLQSKKNLQVLKLRRDIE